MIKFRRFSEVEDEFGIDSSIMDTVAANLGARREELIAVYDEDNGLSRLSDGEMIQYGGSPLEFETSTGVIITLFAGTFEGSEAVGMELLTPASIPTVDNVYFVRG